MDSETPTHDYGKALDVAIPLSPAGAAVSQFQVKVKKEFKKNGKKRQLRQREVR